MPYSIDKEICEGISICVEACPVDCIKKATNKNKSGNDYFYIEFDSCIDCGVCLEVCPIKGAVLPEQREDLQTDR